MIENIEVGSKWADKTNDKIIATVTRLMSENEALQYKTSIGWTTSSVAWFLEDFEPLEKVVKPMTNLKLKRPIKVGDQSTHKKDNTDCEVTSIWINTQGQAVIESVDENNELSTDSVSSFIDNYRKG